MPALSACPWYEMHADLCSRTYLQHSIMYIYEVWYEKVTAWDQPRSGHVGGLARGAASSHASTEQVSRLFESNWCN